MKWSGYKDYAINQQVLFELQECGFMSNSNYELGLWEEMTGIEGDV
jgi:hypothetical protein